jgi:hypothetical protein
MSFQFIIITTQFFIAHVRFKISFSWHSFIRRPLPSSLLLFGSFRPMTRQTQSHPTTIQSPRAATRTHAGTAPFPCHFAPADGRDSKRHPKIHKLAHFHLNSLNIAAASPEPLGRAGRRFIQTLHSFMQLKTQPSLCNLSDNNFSLCLTSFHPIWQ